MLSEHIPSANKNKTKRKYDNYVQHKQEKICCNNSKPG